jgi:hypothetical protein
MEKEECPICLNNIDNDNKRITACLHTFCNSCLDVVFKHNKNCPLCRKIINYIVRLK